MPHVTDVERADSAQLPLRLFLVEDSSLFRERMAEHLASAGRVEIAGYADSEQGAIAALRRAAWDVLILDLQLKQGNGLEVLKALRDHGRPERAKVIVLTDHDYYLYRRKALASGADYFFNKLSDFHFVAAVVEQIAADRAAALKP